MTLAFLCTRPSHRSVAHRFFLISAADQRPSISLLRVLPLILHRRNYSSQTNTRKDLPPPVTKRKPFFRSSHGFTWNDPYHWLSKQDNDEVKKHLERENAYASSFMSDTIDLQSKLKQEMSSRIIGDSIAPPERWGPWLYYARIPEGKDYAMYLRKPCQLSWFQNLKKDVSNFMEPDEEENWGEQKLLDMNELVKGRGYVHLGLCKVSKDHNLLAYTIDFSGQEQFMLFVKDIKSGSLLSKPIIKGVVNMEWSTDSKSLLYTVADAMQRPCRVFKHTLRSRGQDQLLYEEMDPKNYVDISRTKDWQFFTINSNSKSCSEVYLLDAGCSNGTLQLIAKRRPGIEYFVEHYLGCLFILTNSETQNTHNCSNDYKLFLCPVGALSPDNWKQVPLEEHGAIIYDLDIFEKHLILYQRIGGLPRISVLDLPLSINLNEEPQEALHPHILALPEGVCSITPGLNQDYHSSTLRLSVSSPIMPELLLDYDLLSREYKVLQQENVVASRFIFSTEGNSNAEKILAQETPTIGKRGCMPQILIPDLSVFYACDHLRVPSVGMEEVPLTVVYSRKIRAKGQSPALLFGYGAYGEILSLNWCSDYLSLLDRGWVLAFAHVRGGGELGKSWHHSGRVLEKMNSMYDFIECAEFLVKNGYAHKDRVAAKGISAGGLLVASAINMRTDLFRAAILKVPFIDICNTMLDDSLALTVSDYEEWGNPARKNIFEYIRHYSPYDNVKKNVPYPAMLVLSSFLDTRVGYWEGAKWVSRVREYTSSCGSRPVLLRTDMNSGHFSESGRYLHIADTAFEYAFLLKTVQNDPSWLAE